MSVITITELPGKTGKQTLEGREYTRFFHATTSAITDSQKVIFDILGTAVGGVTIPAPGTEHPDDDSTMVNNIIPTQDAQVRTLWHVTVNYLTKQDDDPPPGGSDPTKPTDLRPTVRFGFRQYSQELDKAYQAGDVPGAPTKAVRNSAGDPFDPQPMVETSHLVITIGRNETVADFDANNIAGYQDTLNSLALTIGGVQIGIHEGRMINIGADKRWDFEGDPYYEVVYDIEVARETHLIHVLDRGFYQKIATDDRRRIMESDVGTVEKGKDRPVSEPQLLDGAGLLTTEAYGPQWLDFQPLPAVNWRLLDLPETD